MGIHGLTKLLSDEAPNCMKEVTLDSLTGRKVAVDASMAMYQFLVGGLPRQLSIASHVAYNLHCSCRARPTVCGVMIGRMSPKHYLVLLSCRKYFHRSVHETTAVPKQPTR